MNQVIINCSCLQEIVWHKSCEGSVSQVNKPGSVSVYRVCIPDHQHAIPEYYNLLSADEVYRAGSYHHRRDTDRFVISRAILRKLLGKRSGVPPKDLMFQKTADKKPYQLSDTEAAPKFNVSHAGDMIMIAISCQDVGADIEYIDPTFGFDEVLDFAFSGDEKKHILKADSPRQAFYEIWSRKESLLKATGKGIGNNLAAAQCLDGQNLVSAGSIGSAENWLIRSFTAIEGYVGNISFSHDAPVDFFELESGRFTK